MKQLNVKVQMDNNLTVTASISISASKEKVWDILTNPEKIKLYLFGTNASSDWTKGSEIIFQGEYQGHQYRDKGIIVEIKKDEVLQYTYWSSFSGLADKLENYSLVTYQIKMLNGETTLTVTQKGFAHKQAQQHAQTNWIHVLNKIKELTVNE